MKRWGLGLVAIAAVGVGLGMSWRALTLEETSQPVGTSQEGNEDAGNLPLPGAGQTADIAQHSGQVEEEIWTCEVVVVGGSFGGIAAAAEAMRGGAQTCMIELTPWLGGQISSQGVSAIDESLVMRQAQNFSQRWFEFKTLISQQMVDVPAVGAGAELLGEMISVPVSEINGCWVGGLCFPPEAGHAASIAWLEAAREFSSGSRWGTEIAFKGAELSVDGDRIEAVYAVQRIPRSPDYVPLGELSRELHSWYTWDSDTAFEKVPIRIEPVAGRPFVVIDATDTGELVGWANLPHRLGSESQATTGEPHAQADNPQCTQAFTYPFGLAIADDNDRSLASLNQVVSAYSREEHHRTFSVEGFNFFSGRSFFHYRRMVSRSGSDPFYGVPGGGDVALVNWNPGNDWNVMNPPLILTAEEIVASGQDEDWLGGLNVEALRHGEQRALLFGEWLLEGFDSDGLPLSYLQGDHSMFGTQSGLSMYPYIREGRRILGRESDDQAEFMMREQDIRYDLQNLTNGLPQGRDFASRALAVTNYAIDIHGCRYRNWEPSGEATSAPVGEFTVRPIYIPLEAMVPQQIDNLLIGNKGIAVSHIVNAATRVHYGEWGIGSAAGAVAAFYVERGEGGAIADLGQPENLAAVREQLRSQGLRLHW